MLKIAFFEMEKEKTYTIPTEIAHQKAKELLDRVLNEAKIEGVRVKPKLKAILKVNFYLHFKFGKKLLPFKNLIYDIKIIRTQVRINQNSNHWNNCLIKTKF